MVLAKDAVMRTAGTGKMRCSLRAADLQADQKARSGRSCGRCCGAAEVPRRCCAAGGGAVALQSLREARARCTWAQARRMSLVRWARRNASCTPRLRDSSLKEQRRERESEHRHCGCFVEPAGGVSLLWAKRPGCRAVALQNLRRLPRGGAVGAAGAIAAAAAVECLTAAGLSAGLTCSTFSGHRGWRRKSR
jgi:hypothetical protein